jgi:hypothetical protein
MPKTRAELVNRALSNLGALPAGQTANNEEYNQVDALVIPVVDSLSARDIYYVADATSIPDEAFVQLGHCLAWACAAEFGAQGDTALFTMKEQAEQELSKIERSEIRYIHQRQMRTDFPMISRRGTYNG